MVGSETCSWEEGDWSSYSWRMGLGSWEQQRLGRWNREPQLSVYLVFYMSLNKHLSVSGLSPVLTRLRRQAFQVRVGSHCEHQPDGENADWEFPAVAAKLDNDVH